MKTLASPRTIVNSWNEWDPLRHVIVGVATKGCIPVSEPAVEYSFPPESGMAGRRGYWPEESIARANEELDNLAKVLRGRGIRVDRPTPIEFNQPVVTPDFEHPSMIGCMPARDVLLTVGSEILEATMSQRARWFEYLAYRPLLMEYFENDPNMRWSAAPRPRLGASSYKPGYFDDISVSDFSRIASKSDVQDYVTTEVEPLFDAADATRCGRDIFVQHGFTTNLKGIDWLRRHFPDHRIHRVNFRNDPDPVHIDCSLVPLRPGLMLSNPARPLVMEPGKEALFRRNGWEMVMAAKPAYSRPQPTCYYSIWLSMNFLTLDPKTVITEETEVYQNEQLSKLGFEVIPIPFRHAYPFGGSIHCATADVYREGTCEDLFPRQ
ncbi:arginine deiminase family protein [Sorangium sp. So ce1128]